MVPTGGDTSGVQANTPKKQNSRVWVESRGFQLALLRRLTNQSGSTPYVMILVPTMNFSRKHEGCRQ